MWPFKRSEYVKKSQLKDISDRIDWTQNQMEISKQDIKYLQRQVDELKHQLNKAPNPIMGNWTQNECIPILPKKTQAKPKKPTKRAVKKK